MKQLIYELNQQIVDCLSIKSPENMDVLKRVDKGFSRAEVYRIELKAPSEYTGKFYLKIDPEEDEYQNHDISEKFSCAVKYIKTRRIDGYCIALIEIAGGSEIEFETLFKSKPQVCEAIIPTLTKDMLNDALKGAFYPIKMSCKDIFTKALGNKIRPVGEVEKFMASRLERPVNCAILFQDDLYPNPLDFSRSVKEWADLFYLSTYTHGDFHGVTFSSRMEMGSIQSSIGR